ncbi:MAG: peptide-methionine (S)-S-oxide reductase, partial [Methylohalobius sp.]
MTTPTRVEQATFAGGCFWCMEADFEKTEGVVEVVSGYTGGEVENKKAYEFFFHAPNKLMLSGTPLDRFYEAYMQFLILEPTIW